MLTTREEAQEAVPPRLYDDDDGVLTLAINSSKFL